MQNDDLKNDIVSITGHELRTVMSGNKWALKMLLDHDLGSLNSEQEQLIKKSYENNETMIGLVNQLLTHKESTHETSPTANSEIIVVDLLKEIIEDFRSEAFKRGIEIVFIEPDTETEKLLKLNFNPKLFKIIFQNLLSNALKYNKANGNVFITAIAVPNGVQISVRDTGIGIPKDEQKTMFTKFKRASNAQKSSEDGSGLGLYITSRIIAENGGIIEFESNEGVGTTFTFTLYNN